MKIGIVTQPLWGNYGGILQNYALQQVLHSLGHEAITLDYFGGYSGFSYIIAQCKSLAAYVLGRNSCWKISYAPKRNNPLIASFVSNYIKTTNTFWNGYKSSLIKKYVIDAIIVGSDQVWRPMYNPHLEDMYLAFCKKSKLVKRIAYSASFGTSVWEYNSSQARSCSNLLKRFDAVSVREESGINHLNRLGITTGIVVLDPTLLYGRKGFDALLSSWNTEVCHQRTLGAYILESHDSLHSVLHDFFERFEFAHIAVMKENSCSVIEWIQTIKNSNLFVTDSYHGVVFCIIYHVPFYVILNDVRGNERINSLLSTVGLKRRIIDDLSVIKSINYEINWNQVDSIIETQRIVSMEFLKSNLAVNKYLHG